ncbi:MAG: 16S rRNA (cytosine(967)-C(5))-methyltransferase RsmB [Chloracidobacterium sp.]|nr:16S rRNA (cytosine(967)-C(5))-methyltransferase RsmB [Chloracidobacterium sp.]
MKVSPARLAAFNVLLRIETERSFSSVLLPAYEAELSAPDRALCHELTLGTLRRQMYLDRVIDHCSKGKKLDNAVRVALRLGVYQLLFLDKIPAYSAVDESVNLVQIAKKTSAKGFVNAILRRVTKERPELVFKDEVERLSIETSHPRWLIEKWIDEFGFEQAEQLASANNQAGGHAFRLLGETRSDTFNSRRSEFVEGCYLTDRIDSNLIAAAEKHEIYFQDEGSQMIGWSVKVPAGGNFLDVCAAPGGKTGLIANRHAPSVGIAVAGDLYWQRVVGLRDNCRRQGVGDIPVVQCDAEKVLPFADNSFDAILIDAPCSGTGTIRHNPELRYFINPDDITELSNKQLAILENASKLVKSGGWMIYSTCSLEKEENEMVCGRFLNENSNFQLALPDVPDRFLTNEGFARMFPHRDGMDGFFIAEFRKN